MRLVIVASAVAVTSVSACGLAITGSGSAAEGGAEPANLTVASDAASGATGLDGAVAEPFPASFACGADNCTTGLQACCSTISGFSCVAADAGCPVADSGKPMSPPLLCTSSDQCNGNRRCCFDANAGSACSKSCGDAQLELCSLARGGCGGNGQCVQPATAIAPGVGRCDFGDQQ